MKSPLKTESASTRIDRSPAKNGQAIHADERNKGLHGFLSLPSIYNIFQNCIGGYSARTEMVNRYIRPKAGDRILDIGCGPGEILGFLPQVDYEGYDLNPKYIDEARQRFGERGNFYCQKVGEENMAGKAPYDIVIACGIIHHLNDRDTVHLLELAHDILKPGGRLITVDGCYISGQSPLARYVVSMDRGQHIRTVPVYETLAKNVFPAVTCHIRHDILRIPYTHLFMECEKGT